MLEIQEGIEGFFLLFVKSEICATIDGRRDAEPYPGPWDRWSWKDDIYQQSGKAEG
jgi:hypothetical protein